MEYILAKSAGFCFGVKRGVEIADKFLTENKTVYSLGHMIHNKCVIEKFEEKGMIVEENIDNILDNSDVIIRAHGVPLEVYNNLKAKNINIIDTTCINVQKIHDLVLEYSNLGYTIVIIGKREHPEVVGIQGWVEGDSYIIESIDELDKIRGLKGVAVVSQTTFNKDKNQAICDKIQENCEDVVIHNTICSATSVRQEEAKKIAKEVDAMIVIGDKKSSNSNRLYEISKEICKNSIFIEKNDELDLKFFEKFNKIGVTAGASTPSDIIEEVCNTIASL